MQRTHLDRARLGVLGLGCRCAGLLLALAVLARSHLVLAARAPVGGGRNAADIRCFWAGRAPPRAVEGTGGA